MNDAGGKGVERMDGHAIIALMQMLLIVAFVSGALRTQAQVLNNGDFESGLSGWTTSITSGGSASFSNNTANIHSGTNALLITVSNVGTTSNAVQLASTSFLASQTNTYVLRFWASTSVNFAKIGINLQGAIPVFPQIPFQISTNNNSYQEYLYAFRAAGNITITFNFQSVANYWLDEVEVLDMTHTDGWDILMTYLWQWGQLNYSKTNSTGWGGADNCKSALLPDGSVAWVFNDTWTETLNTFYSNIHGGGSLPRNSVVHQVGTNLYMLKTTTFFVPTNTSNLYWIGDTLVESNKLLVLLSEINASSLDRVGTAIGQLSLPSLALDSITTVPSPANDDYNQVVNGNDGYYYIYWTTNISTNPLAPTNQVRVARTPLGNLAVDSSWLFWTNGGWSPDHLQAVPLPGLVAPWSFTQLGPSNYVAVYMPSLSTTIMAQFAQAPLGPWSTPVAVYHTAAQWGELNYMPNICAGTSNNGIYTIGYSDNGSPDGLSKVAADKSYYNPHYIKANLKLLSPFSVLSGNGGPGSRLSIKFAADKDYGNNAIDNTYGAGVLNTTNWFNFFGPNGASSGMTPLPWYTWNGDRYKSGAAIVYKWDNELNQNNANKTMSNNVALLDGFINVGNNTWYLSVTNLDAPFTNGYALYFYYHGYTVGWGGQDYVRYHSGPTTNSPVLGLRQWNLYVTSVTNTGQFVQDLTASNSGTIGETAGANYFVITNLSGASFDLLITNGNYGGINALEIVANPATTLSIRGDGTNVILTWPQGTLLEATDLAGPWNTNTAASPYTNPAIAPQMFYRLRTQ